MVFDVPEDKNVRTDFPNEITKIENVFIALKDGQKLAASIWMPVSAKDGSLPAILEYLPYRKGDFTAVRDSVRHPYLASFGYASIRVDIRGSGSSDGWLADEYLKQEQDDAMEIFDWIVKQPWSNGNIGMFGKSWGGFNSLQIAARQHPALKAIITIHSTDDRYADDVHYRGGTMMASDMLWWASTMFAYHARPQDPQVVGDRWRENWFERLNTPPNAIEWVRHQTRDKYWKHGSVCEDYSKVDIPVLAVGGWKDGYTNAVFRMIKNLPNCKAIIGPWVHDFPEMASPGPEIGFLQTHIDWWDQHLKGKGEYTNPKFSAFIQESATPKGTYKTRKGRWVGLENYPTPKSQSVSLYTTESQTLVSKPTQKNAVPIKGIAQDHGLFRGTWCPFGQEGDFAADQRLEDSKSIVFSSDPFEKDVDLFGSPKFHAKVSSDKSNAFLSVRLSERFPSTDGENKGESTLISWGILNLSHRNSHEQPEELEQDRVYDVTVEMDVLGTTIKKGNRLEIAVSPTDWPSAWPLPETSTLTLHPGTRLELPRISDVDDGPKVEFGDSEIYQQIKKQVLRQAHRDRQVKFDVVNNVWKIEDLSDEGKLKLLHNNIEYGSINKNLWSIQSDDPLSAETTSDWELTLGRDDWQIKLITHSKMTADKDNFYLRNVLTAYEGDKEVFRRDWNNPIPRSFC